MNAFTYHRIGSTGCEIVTPDRTVLAWTMDETMAMVLVALLNWAEREGLGAILAD